MPLVINDNNSQLIRLYRHLRDHPDAVIEAWRGCVAQWMPCRPDERHALYYSIRERYWQVPDLTAPEVSGWLLFMLQTNFNGKWQVSPRHDHRYASCVGRTYLSHVRTFDESVIRRVVQVLHRCAIHCGDFEAIALQPGDLVYADPPYRQVGMGYGQTFTEDDHARLAQHLMAHDGEFIYSNRQTGDGWYAEHFPTCHITTIPIRYTAGGRAQHDATEVLITRQESIEQPTARFFDDADDAYIQA